MSMARSGVTYKPPMPSHAVHEPCLAFGNVGVEEGLEVALERKKRERPPIEPLFDGEKETRWVDCLLETA